MEKIVETPAFRVQPFRWGNIGAWAHWNRTVASENTPPYFGLAQQGSTFGFAQPSTETTNYFTELCGPQGYGHPFCDTQRQPEGKTWSEKNYWAWRWFNNNGGAGMTSNSTNNGHELAYGKAVQQNGTRVFSINNYDRSFTSGNSVGRAVPSTGTEAVIDELKISGKQWSSTRIADEQTLSRYYLPGNPKNADDCPTFTSQTLLQSLRGVDTATQPELVTLGRVSWTVFTPRFMMENKAADAYTRQEYIGGGGAPSLKAVGYRGAIRQRRVQP